MGGNREEPTTGPPCFEWDDRSMFVVTVKTSRVIDLLWATHVPERIEEYRLQMENGSRFPPVAVIRMAGRYFLADGHKRLSAYRQLGYPEIPVEVWGLSRWLKDQASQVRRSIRRAGTLAAGSLHDAESRKRARRHVQASWTHCKRIVLSARRLLQGSDPA